MNGLWMGGALVLAAACAATEARATDFYVEGQLAGSGSAWRGDGNGQGALRTGFQFVNVIGVEVQGRLGYANVDERLLMGLGVGLRLALPFKVVVPHLRLGMLHFHEHPVSAAETDIAGAIVGVGDGIRHRFGVETALGVDWNFVTVKKTTFFTGVEAFVQAFPDDRGPTFYGGGSLGIGLHYVL